MSYLELLKLAAPETIVVVTALIVLAIGLTTARAARIGSIVAAIGIVMVAVVWPAALASLVCLGLNAGLLRYIPRKGRR